MGIVLAAVLCLAGACALAACAVFLRRRSRRAAGPAASGAQESPGAAAAQDVDGAWVARITDRIPQVARRLAEAAHAAVEGPAGVSAGVLLQGNLAQTPLHDLLQYLALGRKSGTLELVSGRRAGRITLSAGRLARCAYRGKEGLDAAFLMLDLAEGDFEYREGEAAGPAAPDPSADAEVVDVLMHWMARKPRKKQASSG